MGTLLGGPSSEKCYNSVSSERKVPVTPLPSPLNLRCMSRRQNCVMIQHAEDMLKIYNNDTTAAPELL